MMDDDQTDPECVLLLLMERAFRGPEYANAQTRDWRAHMARVLQCVRENDPMVHELRRVIATLEYKLMRAERDALREAVEEIEERTRPNGDMADLDVNLVARAALGER